eukprot:TRINITY_DN1018_c0_g2_i1.p2 TRINITY_DN1018_c0_g2~~TRINITY_DN1018_c0_g2_i1.p2  ORF type:complete len:216 (-),score=67.95 TRINITY_DN1018_c0_g2_i1:15-662(-)
MPLPMPPGASAATPAATATTEPATAAVDDPCEQCAQRQAENLVTVDDGPARRLCDPCTADVKRVAAERNSFVDANEEPLPSLPAPALRAPDPRRRTVVAIETIMRLQMAHAKTVRRRKPLPASPSARMPPPVPLDSKPQRELCACGQPARSRLTVRGSLSSGDAVTTTRKLCATCAASLRMRVDEQRLARNKTQPQLPTTRWSKVTKPASKRVAK